MQSPRVLSGVQPSGLLHLGNYLGALRQWVELQNTRDCLFCIVDLHAITIPERVSPDELRENILSTAAIYLACGVDRQKSTIFVQSDVREHAELGWIMTCLTPVGWLQRMPQYATKSEDLRSVSTGLLCYPALQAADILLYETDEVPVGEDQKHHIDLARDVAKRFNHLYGDLFRMPRRVTPPRGARIMSLQDPTSKMSKSTGEVVGLLDTPKQIRKKVGRAVTDSGNTTVYDACSPGVRNLINIMTAITGEDPHAVGDRYDGRGYGYLKKDVADVVVETLDPVRAEYLRLREADGYLRDVLSDGGRWARASAHVTMSRVREAVGLGSGRWV